MGGLIDIEQKRCESVHDGDLLLAKVRFKDLLDSARGDFRFWLVSTCLVEGIITVFFASQPIRFA